MAGAQGQFAHQLAEASTGIRAQNADAQREEWNRMLGRDQMYLDRNYEGYLDKRNYGKDRIGVMSDALRAITGGSSTGANPNYTSASQNAATWAAIIASMYNS